MKKIIAIILVFGILFSFAACKKSTTSSETESNLSENSSVQTGTESDEKNTEESKDEQRSSESESTVESIHVESKDEPTSSEPDSTVGSIPVESTTVKAKCSHKFSTATCTAVAKCTLCGITKGKPLGHSYSAGKCNRCGAADSNYATYKAGGKNTIIHTTAGGKSTTLKIDTSEADSRFQNVSSFASSPSMDISYTKFLEVDGWLFFAQTINMKYTVYDTTYDVIADDVYKIKTDGTSQTALITYQESDDKGIAVSEVFGFDSHNIYYVLENGDEGICEIYKAPVSTSLKNLVTQGKKIASSPTAYATICKCGIKDGYLYFSEEQNTYDPSTSATVSKMLGNYKMKLDGTGLTKIS